MAESFRESWEQRKGVETHGTWHVCPDSWHTDLSRRYGSLQQVKLCKIWWRCTTLRLFLQERGREMELATHGSESRALPWGKGKGDSWGIWHDSADYREGANSKTSPLGGRERNGRCIKSLGISGTALRKKEWFALSTWCDSHNMTWLCRIERRNNSKTSTPGKSKTWGGAAIRKVWETPRNSSLVKVTLSWSQTIKIGRGNFSLKAQAPIPAYQDHKESIKHDTIKEQQQKKLQ